MADDKGKEKKETKGKGMPSNSEAIGELVKILLILIIISSILGRLGAFVREIQGKIPAGALGFGSSPVGTMIALAKASPLYDSPGGKIIGQLQAGMQGLITKGPLWKDGVRWWFVDFGNGLSGWVPESVLKKADGSAFDPGQTPIGSRVASAGTTSVLDSPGGKEIGTQPPGAKGTVTDGPVYKDGKRYWYVDFDSGPDGWVAETALNKADGSPFDPGDTPIGKQVAAKGALDVFDVPGGTKVGSQPAGAEGIIVKGPEYKDGKRYWYVDFNSGQDGWVAEDMLQKANVVDPGSTPVGAHVGTAGESPLGSVVAVKGATDIFDAPGGVKIGTQPANAKGTVTKGPEYKDGQRWWYVQFENGVSGWVSESALKKADGSTFQPGDTAIGNPVTTGVPSAVLATPGGTQIGTQPAGAKGTVTKGPEVKDGRRYWFVDFTTGQDGWVAEDSLKNPDGSAFKPKVTSVYDVPGGTLIGTQSPGAKGIVTKGPEFKDGKRYWYVDFESGTDGWVAEDQMKNADGSVFKAGKTPIGSAARTSGNTVVYDAPAGTIIGGQPSGAKGIVTKGPIFKDGGRWWYMDFESGPDGWVAEKDLRGPNGEAFDPGDGPIGSTVSLKKSAGVFDESGKQIGTQKKGEKGVIAQGPIYRDGQRYWYVDFESGTDGWVSEKDLGPYQELTTGQKIMKAVYSFLRILSWLIAIALVIGIIVVVIRTNRVVSDMSKGIEPPRGIEIIAAVGNPAWKRVVDLSESSNPSDWKLSIIEADVMLDRMLQGMGYKGETIGDRLKAIERSDFTTLDSAWDAHKVRNRIAHEGGDFLITQRETRRVIALYKQVFDEFRLI